MLSLLELQVEVHLPLIGHHSSYNMANNTDYMISLQKNVLRV